MIKQNTRETNFVSGLKDSLMKTHSVYIQEGSDNRIAVVYEAYADTKDGQDCIATIYMYHGQSEDIKGTLEKRTAKWNGAWDAEMEALPYYIVNGES